MRVAKIVLLFEERYLTTSAPSGMTRDSGLTRFSWTRTSPRLFLQAVAPGNGQAVQPRLIAPTTSSRKPGIA
jgi:hypothetical protein